MELYGFILLLVGWRNRRRDRNTEARNLPVLKKNKQIFKQLRIKKIQKRSATIAFESHVLAPSC